jgi:hypothetical protein
MDIVPDIERALAAVSAGIAKVLAEPVIGRPHDDQPLG